MQDLDDVVNLQAGVVDGHFRGGRTGEVQYQVDGVSVNNAFDNSSSLKLDRSLLQEVQVISGTFDAEYGQAMSGVVNAVLKQGTEYFLTEAEIYAGGFFFPGREEERRTDDTPHLTGTQSYQLNVSGPITCQDHLPGQRPPLPVRRLRARPTRVYNPTDDVADPTVPGSPIVATGDGKQMALGYSDEWSGVVKVTNNSLANTKLNYQAIFNSRESRAQDYAFRFMPDALSIQRSYSISHGFDVTQTLGATSFLDLSVRQNYFEYTDHVYEDIFDPRYDDTPQLDNSGTNGDYFYQGVQLNHYLQKTNTWLFKGSVVSQLNEREPGQDRARAQPARGRVRQRRATSATTSGNPGAPHRRAAGLPGAGHLLPGDGGRLRPGPDGDRRPDPCASGCAWTTSTPGRRCPAIWPTRPTPSRARPSRIRSGTTVKADALAAPGRGLPHRDNAAVHFAYGHFRQFPSIGVMFTNADYDILSRAAGGQRRLRRDGQSRTSSPRRRSSTRWATSRC